ncbi:MAG: HPr family phosphocarrier protein, partial [Sulfurovaceae bacterium]
MSRFFNFFSKELTYTSEVQARNGLHLRPCALLAKKADAFTSTLTLHANGKSADAKKLNALLALGLEFKDTITLSARGSDAKEALHTLSLLLNSFKDEKEAIKLSQSHREYKGDFLKGEAIHIGIAIAKPFIYATDFGLNES